MSKPAPDNGKPALGEVGEAARQFGALSRREQPTKTRGPGISAAMRIQHSGQVGLPETLSAHIVTGWLDGRSAVLFATRAEAENKAKAAGLHALLFHEIDQTFGDAMCAGKSGFMQLSAAG